jgi:hypothetical protein
MELAPDCHWSTQWIAPSGVFSVRKNENMSIIDTALHYKNDLGLNVLPMKPIWNPKKNKYDKKPLVAWTELQTRLVTDEEINKWWTEFPDSGIGAVVGSISGGILAIDCDSLDAINEMEQSLPDGMIIPCSKSISGARHYFFKSERIYKGGTRIYGDYDFQAEKHLITLPPTKGNNSDCYEWVVEPKSFDDFPNFETCGLNSFPAALQAAINNINKSTLYGRDSNGRDNDVTSVTKRDIWDIGSRDTNLLNVARCLTLTKQSDDYIRQTLRAIVWSWGERDEKWIDAKIKSCLSWQERIERNLQAEIDEWISVTEGDWNVTELDKDLLIVTKRDMATRRKCLSRRKATTIEKVNNRNNWWRRIDSDIEFMDFNEPEGIVSNVKLPFELDNLVDIMQGNIVLVSGEFNAGKTCFSMNVLLSNRNRMPIRFISSEMKVSELKKWFRKSGISKELWYPDENCTYVALKNNLPTLLLPDALNIIDYLEFRDGDYTQGAEIMRQIHDRLNTGIAVVCNQQKMGARLPRSGDLILEKPRLAITLRKIETENDDVLGFAEIIKAKSVKLGKMDGKRLKYEIIKDGTHFKTVISWGYWR